MALSENGAPLTRPKRWLAHILRRFNFEKRPRITAWTTVAIVDVILLFGVLGYAIPTLIAGE